MISFFVPGIPKTAGSKTAYVNPKTGRAIVTDASGKPGKNWRALVSLTASQHCKEPLSGPVKLYIIFYLPRPKSHYGTGKNANELKLNAPLWHDKIPDGLKLRRAVEDALTGIAWRDDAQVAIGTEEKRYAAVTGAEIRIEVL